MLSLSVPPRNRRKHESFLSDLEPPRTVLTTHEGQLCHHGFYNLLCSSQNIPSHRNRLQLLHPNMSPRENPPQLPSRDSFNSVESVLEDKLEFSTDVDLHQSRQTHDTSLVEGRRVVFGNIQVREYNRIIGDNPSVRVGVPVSLDWQFSELPEMSVDDYENSRPPYKSMLRLSSITRRNILMNVWGFSEEDIAEADKEIQKIKRRQSRGPASAAIETTTRKAGGVGRKLRKGIMKSLVATSRYMAPHMMVQAY